MEKFVYSSVHLPALKKYGIMRILFLLLGCLVLLLQSIAWLIVWNKNIDISVTNMVFVGVTLMYALYFIASQVFFAVRNKKIIATIKQTGSFTTKRVKLRFSNKTSLGGALIVFTRIIMVIFVILLGIMITNFVQDYVNWGKVILKVPFMVLFAVGILNLLAEFKYQSMIEQAK